jgi:hypothetical protein
MPTKSIDPFRNQTDGKPMETAGSLSASREPFSWLWRARYLIYFYIALLVLSLVVYGGWIILRRGTAQDYCTSFRSVSSSYTRLLVASDRIAAGVDKQPLNLAAAYAELELTAPEPVLQRAEKLFTVTQKFLAKGEETLDDVKDARVAFLRAARDSNGCLYPAFP